MRLRKDTTASITLPFNGLKGPQGVAVDSAGNVYVADAGNNRVLKLPAS
jgi:serine/threonine-protein kinase